MAPRRLQICSFRLDASYRRHPGLSVSVEPSHRTGCVMRSGRGSLARRCVMKKLELTMVPLLVMLPLSPAAGKSPCNQIATNCQELRAWFSAPPNAGTVLNLSRSIQLADGPLTETVIQGVVDKYGQPGFRKRFPNGVALVWAWAPDGSTMALN